MEMRLTEITSFFRFPINFAIGNLAHSITRADNKIFIYLWLREQHVNFSDVFN